MRAVRQFAGARHRTVDDHMFRARTAVGGEASFRLQLFTAPGQRPVAVVTQTTYEGASLTNAAERFAAAVWERHCPEEKQPPVWVQRQLLHDDDEADFQLVTFKESEPYRLARPGWRTITSAQMEELVGGPVATDRGSGYVEPVPEPEPEAQFRVMAVCRLPRPHPFREDDCMPKGTPWWRRWLRQAVPTRNPRNCCWYHRGDWHALSRIAITVLAQAEESGVSAEDMADFADDYAMAVRASQWQREALDSLFSIGTAIQADRRGYVNGQHRAQAMLDAGVHRTIVLRTVRPTAV